MARRRRRGSSKSRLLVGAAVIVVVVAGLALGVVDIEGLTGGGGGGNAALTTGTSGAGSPSEASDALATLEVEPEGSMSGYSRDEFPHWSGADEFGWEAPDSSCDTRDASLIRDGDAVEVGESCDIESGEWLDPYAGETITDSSSVDIDHIVPLANAWRSGADEWDEPLREEFANAQINLLSTDPGENRSKGDRGPETWRPTDEGAWCDYSARWVSVKSEYELSVNEGEKAALEETLATCEAG
ncbi:MAG: HNH endonuclease [Rubrobacter sp.]|nr:HNH endonuclease [Rubrobacter sp.]